ncbi:TcpQ domain-containing protein [Buttiauxella agrestis]
MKKNKVLIVGLVANAITACSSPPQLTEPDGDWISFEAPQQTTKTTASVRNPYDGVVLNTAGYAAAANSNTVNSLLTQTPPAGSSLIALVKSDGKKVPLYKAVRSIVPESMSVRLSPDVAQSFRGTVSWTGNDQWPIVLRKMLAANGLKAEINSAPGDVLVQYAQKASVPVTAPPVKPVMINSAVPSTKPAKMLQTPLIPVVTEGPKPAPAAKVSSSAKAATPIKVIPVAKPAPVLKKWTLDKGISLKAGYLAWVAKETCPGEIKKWTVRWETDTDYPIDYPLSFNATSFEQATSQLFNLYLKAESPLYVNGYRNQCLIVISDRK